MLGFIKLTSNALYPQDVWVNVHQIAAVLSESDGRSIVVLAGSSLSYPVKESADFILEKLLGPAD